MKKYLHSLLFLLTFLAGTTVLAENVSTALTSSYTSQAIGLQDAWWTITAGPNGPAPALRQPTFGGFWEPTPVIPTNAGWINQSGTSYGNTPGDYTFERQFTVSPNDGSIYADFGVAWDDILLYGELVPPPLSGWANIPLNIQMSGTNQYWLGPSVNEVVMNPPAGVWRIRIVVRFVDNIGGLLVSGDLHHCPKYNISTGIDNNGNSIGIGVTDPNWIISAGPGGPTTKRVTSFPGYWQPTPVIGTNAGWINYTGTYNDPAGVKTFDRSFNIPAGTSAFQTNFSISWDDELVSLELVPPPGGGAAIPLPVTTPVPYYYLSPVINYTVVAPFPGNWTVRAKVRFIDQLGALMLSGYISTLCDDIPFPCDCDAVNPNFSWTTDADCSTHFTASSGSNCFEDVQYEWTSNGMHIGNGQTLDYSFPANGTYNVCLTTVTNVNGEECVEEVCRQVTITCNPCTCAGLSIDFESLINGCNGNFTAITQGNSCMDHFDYQWTVNGVPAGNSQTLNYAFTSNGTYNVCVFIITTLPDGTQCIAEKCKQIQVTNCGGCNCDMLNGNFTFIVDKCNIRLIGPAIPSCMTNPSYVWTINGAPAGTGQVINKTVSGNGTYVVCLQISANLPGGAKCGKQICKDVVVTNCASGPPAGLSPIQEGSVILYPNPATEQLNIDFNTEEDGEVTISFKTVDGKEILRESKVTEAGAQHFELSIPSSVAGEMIFVEITSGASQIVRKVNISTRN
jgi:hypothetical protein